MIHLMSFVVFFISLPMLFPVSKGAEPVSQPEGEPASVSTSHAERPNILWISVEDISSQLGCYGDKTATTPHLDQLASEGTLFTHAFTCHGVCAPSRTGIITGMSPVSLGANHMRSKAGLPNHIRLFPELLRDAGYYCTNNSKTDYNLNWNQKVTWDASSNKAHWKNRPDTDTPFFAVFNLTMTHESKVWPTGWQGVVKGLEPSKRHRPEDAIVPPLYPNTQAVREDFARLADLITVMDMEVGRLLTELDEAGLRENTIVIFWSDHGNGLPRAKRWTYDSGSRVPMIVRAPEAMRSWTGLKAPGSIDDRMISLTDLGPSVLNLCGIDVPDHMQARAFLGPNSHPGHDLIYGARDRLDERFDMVRTVRDRRFRYVRNLMPWRPTLLNVHYGETNETMKEMRRMLANGTLPAESAQWFAATRAPEELYDLDVDPWELKNLAADPAFQTQLNSLRKQLDDWQLAVRDAHLLPEIMLDEVQRETGERWSALQGEAGLERTRRLLEAAKQTATQDPKLAVRQIADLDEDRGVRWWQVTLAAKAPHPEQRLDLLRHEATGTDPCLQIAAAGGLAHAGQAKEAALILGELAKSSNTFIRHAALLEIDESGPAVISELRETLKPEEGADQENARRLIEHALR